MNPGTDRPLTFDRYVSRADRETFLSDIQRTVTMVSIVEAVCACSDPTDDKFLEAAVNGGAGTIITGDRALLALHPFRGIAIITPRDYRRRVGLPP